MTQLQWARSHGDMEPVETTTRACASAAPPAHGGGAASADALPIVSRGSGGLSSSERPSMWEMLTDTADDYPIRTQLTQLLERLEDSPSFRRGQVAGALADLQQALQMVSHQAEGDDRVSLPAGTLVVIAHTLLRHQP